LRQAGLPITNELTGGVRGDITGGADEVEALNYEVKRKQIGNWSGKSGFLSLNQNGVVYR
jgi:hypothetical protein